MTETRKVIKVFLASPGDLADERRAAKSVVDEFNRLWADSLGYHVELVGWEETVSRFGRPQEIINRDLERCEFFVGMVFRRWGTPPGGTSAYTSGFEEEFETSVRRRRKMGKPEIGLLFKTVDPVALRDPGPELAKVIAFKDKIASERTLLYEAFSDLDEFRTKFRACITAYVQKLRSEEAGELSEKSRSAPDEPAERQAVNPASERETPFSVEGARFLRDFIARTEQHGQIDPVEVARFRLLGSIIGRQGNDEHSLNVHDSNLLFTNPTEIDFSRGEILELIRCGLEHYTSENTPIWRWYAAADGFRRGLLSFLSLFGTASRRAGAITAMRLIAESA
jgi:hypothetical protein